MESLLPILFIFWAIFSFVSKQAQKKKKEEAARAARERAQGTQDVRPVQPAAPAKPQAAKAAPASPYYDDRSAPARQGSLPPTRPEGGPPYYTSSTPAKPKFDPQTGARLTQEPARTVSGRMQQPPAARQTATLQSRAQTSVASTLTDINERRHPLDSAGRTGHAHEETSITGVQGECPPEKAVRQTASSPAPVYGFRWDQNAVLSGLVYAEILSPPKALRRR